MLSRRNLAESFAKFRLRLGRGHSLWDFFITLVKNIVYFGALGILIERWFHFSPPTILLVSLAIVYEIGCYITGLIDEKIGFWKFESRYATEELNPFFKELNEDIKKLTNKL